MCGAVAALGTYLATIPDPAWLGTLGKVLVAVATAGIGLFARDNDKTSEDVNAK